MSETQVIDVSRTRLVVTFVHRRKAAFPNTPYDNVWPDLFIILVICSTLVCACRSLRRVRVWSHTGK
jgi:hypothetical protein